MVGNPPGAVTGEPIFSTSSWDICKLVFSIHSTKYQLVGCFVSRAAQSQQHQHTRRGTSSLNVKCPRGIGEESVAEVGMKTVDLGVDNN